jgi:hypothetical protein
LYSVTTLLANSRERRWLLEVSPCLYFDARISLLTRSVTLILKTTDLSSAGYALSVGSGGVAVSGSNILVHVSLTLTGRNTHSLPVLAPNLSGSKLLSKDILSIPSDAPSQQSARLRCRYRRYIYRETRYHICCRLLGHCSDIGFGPAGPDSAIRTSAYLVSPFTSFSIQRCQNEH